MRGEKVKNYLDSKNIKYITITHSPAYTAQGIAHSAHISGKEIAKTVILNVAGKLAMMVVPGNHKVNLDLLKKIFSTDYISLADEDEFKTKFPDCEVGAMPPFGNLYDMDVYISEELSNDKEIAFNAGTHTELIRMEYTDYMNLVHPKKINLAA